MTTDTTTDTPAELPEGTPDADPAVEDRKTRVRRLTELPKDGNRRIIDLAESRRAREEKVGPPPLLKVSDDLFYELPRSMSAEFVAAIADAGQYVEERDLRLLTLFDVALEALLGVELFAELRGELDLEDRVFVLERALEVYGFSLPESSASES